MQDIYPIDLRSDTVTKPTDAMRKVMASAEVGDDVFGEDPTVNRLQERTAEILGKEAALFVPSGTMANQIALAAQTIPGDEILLDAGAHILNYEGGAPALLSGLQLRTLEGKYGLLTADQIRSAVRGGDSHFAPTTLVTVENTHNRAGGTVYSVSELNKIGRAARKSGLRIHLDGARIWNAAVSSDSPEAEISDFADSVSCCFSKGLGAPVGSAVTGSREFIRRAHRYRKIFGGGMRQAGIIAAAALYALDHHRERLAEDHEKAKLLAERITRSGAMEIEGPVQTNIILASITADGPDAQTLVDRCAKDGVLFFAVDHRRIRLVTHLDVSLKAMKPAAETILKNLKD